jgi:mono/diheme cytochrome c family protein
VSSFSRILPLVIGGAAVAAAFSAQAQSNAGKSSAQIFGATCNACHRSPRELKPTNAGYLRQHYTTGGQEAAAMAAYLAEMGSDPRAVANRNRFALRPGRR